MTQNARFEVRLPADRRRELAELAAETGISSSDLARVGIGWVLEHRGVLVNGPRRSAGRSPAEFGPEAA